MAFDPDRHNRRSMRLPGHDYAAPGSYYVTIVIQDRELLFGTITADEASLNAAGRMVERWWTNLAERFANVALDTHVVMPNHLHGVLNLVAPGGHIGPPLHRIVGWFKTMTTNAYLRGVKESGWPPVVNRLWQRGYYDHIVRDEEDLERIREYIQTNPERWTTDAENPTVNPNPKTPA